MPGIVLAFTAIPALTRLTRSGMIEAMASDYIRTARAKGLSRARIIFKHALRNAVVPVVALTAVQLMTSGDRSSRPSTDRGCLPWRGRG